MTTRFVFSGATGANDGTSWANAWTSEASSVGVAAGDIVKAHKTHNGANNGANLNWSNGTPSNPVQLACVDKDAGDALSTGATFNWNVTNVGPQGNLLSKGLTFKSSAAVLRASTPVAGYQRYENCLFAPTGSTGVDFLQGGRSRFDLINTDIDLSGASAATAILSLINGNGTFNMTGGTYTCRATQTTLMNLSAAYAGNYTFRGVNFSGAVTNLFVAANNLGGLIRFDGCAACAYVNIASGGFVAFNSFRVNLDGFQSGTLLSPLLRPNIQADGAGTLRAIASRYRTGGTNLYTPSSDLSVPYSWEVTTTANANNLVLPFETPQRGLWVEAGPQTLTFYVASVAVLKNDELWVEVLSPSEAASPTAQFAYRSTRCDVLAAPVALATDSTSEWNGSGVGTKQQIQVSINPTMAGVALVHWNVAKPTTVVYIDPKVVVS